MRKLNFALRTPLLTALITAASSMTGLAMAAEVPVGTA